MIRKALFWLHLSIGVLAGAVILLMSVTGVVLAFERQIIAVAEQGLRATPEQISLGAQPISALVASAAADEERPASAILLRSDPAAPLAISFGRGRTVFVNRYTGRVLGEGARRLRAFFDANMHLHRWLALEGDRRELGKAITGGANLAFLFITISGAFLWIPRRLSRSAFRNVTLFRTGLQGKARDFNWHNVLGIWSFLPLVFIVFSGSVISYPWMSALVYRAFGDQAPARAGSSRPAASDLGTAEIDRLWKVALGEASRITPDWRTMSLRLPVPDGEPARFAVDRGSGARPDKRSQLAIDATSGVVVAHETYAAQGPGHRARAWLRWIHTGEAGGVPGQIIAMLASSAAVVLVWTGISLALRRLARSIRTRRTEAVFD